MIINTCDPEHVQYDLCRCDPEWCDSGDPCDYNSSAYNKDECYGVSEDSYDPCDYLSIAYDPIFCYGYGGGSYGGGNSGGGGSGGGNGSNNNTNPFNYTANAYGFSTNDFKTGAQGTVNNALRDGLSTVSTVLGLGTALPAITLSTIETLMTEIGFTNITKLGKTANGLSFVGASIGTVEFAVAVAETYNGEEWKNSDSLNALSVGLGWFSLYAATSVVLAPIALPAAGLSLIIGFASAAESSSGN